MTGIKKVLLTSLVLIILLIIGINREYWYSQALEDHYRENVTGHFVCSWLKAVPNGWSCYDNWQRQRVNIAHQDDQSLQLYIGGQEAQTSPCQITVPLSMVHNPSPSGFSVPYRCLDKNIKTATWKQDGSHFRLTGENVSKDLFLLNLRLAGRPFTLEKAECIIDENAPEEGCLIEIPEELQ